MTDCNVDDGGRKKSYTGNLCVSACKYDEYIDTFECKKCSDTFTDCITCTDAPSSKCTECISTKKVETTGTCKLFILFKFIGVTTCAVVMSLADPTKCASNCVAGGVRNVPGTACIVACPASSKK